MSRPSHRFFRWLGLLGALLLSPGSTGCGHGCTLKGCSQGLHIVLDRSFDGRTLELVVSELTSTPEVVPFMRCDLKPRVGSIGHDAFCNSSRPHHQQGGITIDDFPAQVVVAVSEGGVKLGQQTFTPAYTNEEINGPGCGRCHFGSVTVSMAGLKN